ncbi:Rust resistance kinase Lr10 [Vitis vinifera]|uniref:Rust resistance kinase Lr10 n=1 Tax=Vitis vinifera TaxID=29760 RepID=A0A438CI19_VITVI|nr:Rust resistance kinase Lr10 [Vitis vinifera]
MLRETKVVALTVFHTFLLAICAANGNQTCRPSSCGDIQKISNPFRLKGDPSGCGDPDYELVCENNRTMVNLEHGKYYVADINYDNYTIRVVDPGVEKGNCFSAPLYSLTREIFRSDKRAYFLNPHEATNTTVLMNCEQPISDGNYIPITPCNRSNVTSSSSQAYVYALVGGGDSLLVNDIKYSCTISRTIITQFLKPGNLSMSDLQEILLQGLDISFLLFRCKSECHMKGPYCDLDWTKNTVKCVRERYNYCYHYETALYLGWVIRYIEIKWALVYDFMPNGSLDKDVTMQILHFDIKPHNILLDEDFTPKVSNFGLAKLYSTNDSIVSITAARGTLGYIAPKLFYKKHWRTFKSMYFTSWIYNRYDQEEDMKMGDATEDEKRYVRKMVIVALWCIQMKPIDRPSMSQALEMLEGEVELSKMPPKPTLWSIDNHEQFMVEASTS